LVLALVEVFPVRTLAVLEVVELPPVRGLIAIFRSRTEEMPNPR
jgi:hypothetical protein